MAIVDLKDPAGWPRWLVRLAAWLNRPYGVSLELAERHPWESVRRYLDELVFEEMYFGALYLSVGEAPRRQEQGETMRLQGTLGALSERL